PSPIRGVRAGLSFDILKTNEQGKGEARRNIDSIEGTLKVPTMSRSFIAANAAIVMVILAFTMFVLGNLRRVFRTLIDSNPFVPENATRIRWVGLAVIAGEFARATIVFAESMWARENVVVEGLRFDAWPHLNFSVIGYGLI